MNENINQGDDENNQVSEEMKNIFILLEFVSGTIQIIHGPGFVGCAITAKEPCRIVSIIGPPGVGKSLLAGFLCDLQSSKPSVSRNASCWTADLIIHCYYGKVPSDFNPQGVEMPFIIVDSEGTGGTKPRQLQVRLERISEIWKQQYPDWGKNLPYQHEKRRAFVDIAYPRLLKMFSDVFCFVFNGVKQKNAAVDHLLNYARTASEGSTNQVLKPRLIIIFNQIDDIAA